MEDSSGAMSAVLSRSIDSVSKPPLIRASGLTGPRQNLRAPTVGCSCAGVGLDH